MVEVEERRLPGVGLCHEFLTRSGLRLGVVSHKSGRREVLAYEEGDPDAAHELFTIDPDEARALAELLGGTTITEHLSDLFQASVGGMTLEWVTVGDRWFIAGKNMDDVQLRPRTGVTLIAITRGDDTIPSPGPEEHIEPSDTLVLVGQSEALKDAEALLEHGPE